VSGTLYVVGTPLGNTGDLAPRALEALRAADVVLAEDTRTAAALLRSAGARVSARSCFDATAAARADETAGWLAQGKTVALVSEAGTPGISDPGFRIVRAAIAAGARVVPVPGPAALILALVGSGLPTDRFFFGGFPPRRPGPRRALFASLRGLPATLIFYESPHRAADTLADLAAALGPERPACIARELTKRHEEYVREPLGELARRYAAERPLGEVTLVVGGDTGSAAAELDVEARARRLLDEGASPRDAAARLAAESGLSKREAYAIVLGAKPR
jgi:16S rRNA (cytidine1402-2'-O)-methyltransferase